MELLFEACLCYVWYYLHRSYVERVKIKGIEDTEDTLAPLPSPVESDDTDLDEIKTLLKTLLDAQISTNKIVMAQYPTHTPNGSKNGLKSQNLVIEDLPRSIGFFTQAQRVEMETALEPTKNECGHMRTHEDTAQNIMIDDRYTVPHTYRKGGKEVTVHYTARMIKSRVGGYERKVEEAEKKPMVAAVIENRKKWLSYWKEKQKELFFKQKNTVNAAYTV